MQKFGYGRPKAKGVSVRPKDHRMHFELGRRREGHKTDLQFQSLILVFPLRVNKLHPFRVQFFYSLRDL